MSDSLRLVVDGALAAGETVTLDDGAAHHLRVRRAKPGDRISLYDGVGGVGEAKLVGAAAVEVETVVRLAPLPPVHLLAPVADRERMLWLAEKATELAVTSWTSIRWRRSMSVSPRGEGEGFRAKLLQRQRAAAEQSGNPWLPTINPDADPSTAAAAAARSDGTRYLLMLGAPPMFATMPHAPITIALGPEGGLEPDEADLFHRAGFVPVSIGTYTMRFETAGAAAIAIARALLEPR